MNSEAVLRLESLCLRHPGIEIVGFVDDWDGLAPRVAWSHVARWGPPPSLVFADDHFPETHTAWWGLAHSNGLLSREGTCLISVGNVEGLRWARIRLPDQAPVLDIFARYKGCPEFIVMGEAGNRLLAVTSEEYDTWLYLLEHQNGGLRTIYHPRLPSRKASRPVGGEGQ